MAAHSQSDMDKPGTIFVSPFYHEAKNEITRPNHFVGCSRYLVEKWLPRLGPLGFSLVLYLRSQGYYNPDTGERRDSIQLNQADVCATLGVSLDTLQREMKRNEALNQFVRVNKSYRRKQSGHLKREDSVYYIAMDDPIVPEDEPLLEAILARKEAEAKENRRGQVLIRPAVEDLQNHKPQNAVYGDHRPQNAVYGVLDRKPQNAVYGNRHRKPQIAAYIESILTDIPKNNNIPDSAAFGGVVVASIASLVQELIAVGVTQKVAQHLVSSYGEEAVQKQLKALVHRKHNDPAAILVKSIQENWEPPAAANKPRPRPKLRIAPPASVTPALEGQETDREVMRAALAGAREKVRRG